MDLQRLERNLRLAVAVTVRESDAAEDGPEVGIIRQELGFSNKWYRCLIDDAMVDRAYEDLHILQAETLFCRKVGL